MTGPGRRRQAVILIHGIGEQRPMETLRAFVDAVLDQPVSESQADAAYYSKPDLLSDNYELRRLVSRGPGERTDFYEFYWAHLMPTAALDRLLSWYWMLMYRRWGAVPTRLRPIWLASWLALAAALALGGASIVRFVRGDAGLEGAPWLFAAAIGAIGASVRSRLGDAAVYLSPSPPNIEARQKIRAAGLALLDRVTASGRYDRVLVVGHSLGSVIGYDVLTLAWQRHSDHVRHALDAAWTRGERPETETPAIAAAERLTKQIRDGEITGPAAADAWRAATRAVAAEQALTGTGWRVSDFVTLGSPLTHADLLLARSPADFRRRARERELPLSPPVRELNGRFSFEHVGIDAHGAERRATVLNHAAPFAVTAWTNLYFPARGLLHGDIIGGPLAPLFWPGIRDVAVATRARGGRLTHSEYWGRDPRDTDPMTAPVAALRTALDLGRTTLDEQACR